jgi:hypothetical protein
LAGRVRAHLRIEAIDNDLASNSQPGGWSALGAALQGPCVVARDNCGRAFGVWLGNSRDEQCVIGLFGYRFDDGQHAGGLFYRNVGSALCGGCSCKQSFLVFPDNVVTRSRLLADIAALGVVQAIAAITTIAGDLGESGCVEVYPGPAAMLACFGDSLLAK